MSKVDWRSIRYKGYKEDTLPSKKTLLYLYFEDNYGNRFRWTPPWKDLEEVFIKAIDVEKRNYPEGAWDEELKTVISKSPSRPHDIETFKTSDSIINEHAIKELFNGLEFYANFNESQAISFFKYLEFFNYESNKYISKILHDCSKRMLNKLEELNKYMREKFFPISQEREDMKYKLWDAYHVIEEMGIDQETRDHQFYEYWEELKSIVQDSRSVYTDYRSNIREILFL